MLIDFSSKSSLLEKTECICYARGTNSQPRVMFKVECDATRLSRRHYIIPYYNLITVAKKGFNLLNRVCHYNLTLRAKGFYNTGHSSAGV